MQLQQMFPKHDLEIRYFQNPRKTLSQYLQIIAHYCKLLIFKLM